jgi:hypothetical protein
MDGFWFLLIAFVLVSSVIVVLGRMLVKRGYHRWLGPYLLQTGRRRPPAGGQNVHLLLCIADHFEPRAKKASVAAGRQRVEHWVREYPRQLGRFRDSDGRPPRYSFFFPIEQYEADYLDGLGQLCLPGFAEVEIHLHHNGDTADNLRRQLLAFSELLAGRHGLLSRYKETGQLAYAFIHGNWALCNCWPNGAWCGVDNELDILRETGCYADFTFPSAPHPTQPPILNSIYYARNQPGPRSHESGVHLGAGPAPEKSLLLIQGPLLLDWSRRKWGLLPRLENGCLQASQPPSTARLDAWLRARVQAPTRPDWFFVKLHAHGAPEESHEALLGPPMVQFHEELARRARDNPRFHYHYVTARELYNLAKAAEAGFQGQVQEARDFLIVPNFVKPQI